MSSMSSSSSDDTNVSITHVDGFLSFWMDSSISRSIAEVSLFVKAKSSSSSGSLSSNP